MNAPRRPQVCLRTIEGSALSAVRDGRPSRAVPATPVIAGAPPMSLEIDPGSSRGVRGVPRRPARILPAPLLLASPSGRASRLRFRLGPIPNTRSRPATTRIAERSELGIRSLQEEECAHRYSRLVDGMIAPCSCRIAFIFTFIAFAISGSSCARFSDSPMSSARLYSSWRPS